MADAAVAAAAREDADARADEDADGSGATRWTTIAGGDASDADGSVRAAREGFEASATTRAGRRDTTTNGGIRITTRGASTREGTT